MKLENCIAVNHVDKVYPKIISVRVNSGEKLGIKIKVKEQSGAFKYVLSYN